MTQPKQQAGLWRRTKFRLFVFFGFVGLLLWEVVTRSGAAYLAKTAPERALSLQGTQARALLNLAEKELRDTVPKKQGTGNAQGGDAGQAEAKDDQSTNDVDAEADAKPPPASQGKLTSQTLGKIRSLAEQALVNDPLNARALRILGQVALQTSDQKHAETFMHAAVRHSLFETNAVNWMMDKAYKDKKFDEAMRYAQILVKTRQQVFSYVGPILAGIAENQGSSKNLTKLLVTDPAIRKGFFPNLLPSISDARTPLVILLALKGTTSPPTVAELRGYLNFLVDRKFYDLAYYTWLQFLPAQQLGQVGNLYNGSFEAEPSGMPFDWVWKETPGATIQVAERSDQKGGHALNIGFASGRVEFSGATELVMLPPGNYQLRGSYKADLTTQRGLQWRVTCAGGEGSPLGESTPIPEQTTPVAGQRSSWQDFEFSFAVPKDGCPAQYVALVSTARSASEQFISGTIWCDDLKIVNETIVAPSRGL
jgi:hypothetical protein